MIRVERYGPWVAAVGVALAFIIFIGGGLYTVHHQRDVNEKLCEITVENRKSDRVTWNTLRALLLPTTENDEEINRLIDGILRPIPPLVCVDNQPVPKEEQ